MSLTYYYNGNKKQLNRMFVWNTRNKMAPKFRTCSIHHYQNTQFNVIDIITRDAQIVLKETHDYTGKEFNVRVRNGLVWVQIGKKSKWLALNTPRYYSEFAED